MKILIVGGAGFVGRHLAAALRGAGHEVTITSRQARPDVSGPVVIADYTTHQDPLFWRDQVRGMDCVINAAGILVEGGGSDYHSLHEAGPIALFRGCEEADVRRVIQVSALGADDAVTAYQRTKKAADDWLRQSGLDWVIVQPSVIFGEDAESTKMFRRIASMPVLVVPGDGSMRMQPVHVDDLAELVVALVADPALSRETIAAVGPRDVSYREYLEILRRNLGRGRAPVIGTPLCIMRPMARLAQFVPGSTLTPDTLTMLERGSTAAVDRFQELLGRAPRGPETFLAPEG